MKCTCAIVKFSFSEQLVESVQEMIVDGLLSDEDDIKNHLTDCVLSDIEAWILHSPNSLEVEKRVSFDIVLE
jgi:hypothetical protein